MQALVFDVCMFCGRFNCVYNFFLPYFLQNGSEDVKKHKWFKGVIWEDVPLLKLNVRFHVVSNIGKLEMFFLIYD